MSLPDIKLKLKYETMIIHKK